MLKWIEIDLSAIEANLEAVRRHAPGVRLLGVVKADAYGHGAGPVAKLLKKRGVEALGVLTVDEALGLRKAGIAGPIWVLSPALPEQAEDVARSGLTATVDNVELVAALSAASRKLKKPKVAVHVDVDFGLGRWGVPPKDAPALARKAAGSPGVRLEGVSTHLDYVAGKNAVEAEQKLRAFDRLSRKLGKKLIRHAANSSILLDFPHWRFDYARVGNLLYGINPTGHTLPLTSPWKLYARVISVKTVPKGRPIGYGSEYLAPRKMTVAALPVGYADGLTMEPVERLIRLAAGSHYWGILRGHQVPFIGRCGIAHVLVDATDVPNVRPGDEVALPIRRTAATARIPRVYKTRA